MICPDCYRDHEKEELRQVRAKEQAVIDAARAWDYDGGYMADKDVCDQLSDAVRALDGEAQ